MAIVLCIRRILLLLCVLSRFGQGQKYFIGSDDPEGQFYHLNQQQQNQNLPFYEHQQQQYFSAPGKDLQTSDLPRHLQQTLPQYQHHLNNVPFPFRPANHYVIPSTHRPDYAHLLNSHRFQQQVTTETPVEVPAEEPLEEELIDNVEPVTNRADNDLNEEEYDDEYEYEDDEEDAEGQNEENEVLTTVKPEAQLETTSFVNESSTQTSQDFPEYVVSVVTSKTIVNNTIISPVNYNATTTELSVEPVMNTTDSWIVIASVQTSRSTSGAHYIPSSTVDQEETRHHLLNEDASSTESSTQISSTTSKTSTESLIDKLDRVQSDLSSGLLTGGFKNDNIAVIEETTTESPATPLSVQKNTLKYPQVNIRRFNAANRTTITKKPERTTKVSTSTAKPTKSWSNILDKIKPVEEISDLLPPEYKLTTTEEPTLNNVKKIKNISPFLPPEYKLPVQDILAKAKPVDDIASLLPPGYKPSTTQDVLAKAKPVDDISALLPPGYKPSKTQDFLAKAKPVSDISALLPPGYKPPKTQDVLTKAKPVDDISALLPPGYKLPKSQDVLAKTKPVDDISALLPPGYKLPKSQDVLAKAKPVEDISALLPPGYKIPNVTSVEDKKNRTLAFNVKPIQDISSLLPSGYKANKTSSGLLSKAIPVDDISALLPPGYKKGFSKPKITTTAPPASIPTNLLPPGYKINQTSLEKNIQSAATTSSPDLPSTSSGTGLKVVFPSRPGGGSRKTTRTTTPRTQLNDDVNKPTLPTIQKGWPIRASTEFTGWPTPSTTPISIEKLLEAARAAATSTSTTTPVETSTKTTTTTTTTTTSRPTTPGICAEDCDLAGTIKLIGGAKWMPELLDSNTIEYQHLAETVRNELEGIYNNSDILKRWYRKIRIDGFSEGSVLVDYLVEFSDIGRNVDTQEIKRLFHESLSETSNVPNREGKSLNETKLEKDRVRLGQFEIDPKYTDFIVIPKQSYPTVGFAEDVLLPQWAIAVIVIGLASLLFVIIFGVTVLFNRHKNSKKTPTPLTEDMLNELNKNHMGGIDNYGVDDFYNMEDVWSDKHYEQKPYKKRHQPSHQGGGGSSLYDNSTANLYDSWRSQWNAYNNGYYGNGSHFSHYRRSERDTNF